MRGWKLKVEMGSDLDTQPNQRGTDHMESMVIIPRTEPHHFPDNEQTLLCYLNAVGRLRQICVGLLIRDHRRM